MTPSAAVSKLPQDHTLKLPKHNKTRGQPLPSPTTLVPLVGALDSSRSYINIFRLFYCRARTEIRRVVLLCRFHVPLPPLLRVRRRDFLPTPSRQFGWHSLADHRTTRRVLCTFKVVQKTRVLHAQDETSGPKRVRTGGKYAIRIARKCRISVNVQCT